MQDVGGDPTALQAARQLVGEHHVGQLGCVVGTLPRVLLLTLQVVEVEATCRMRAGRHGDDPGWGAGFEPVEQQVGEQKRREVVEREGVLQAIGGDVPVRPEPADVVDQHVQPRIPLERFACEAAYFGLQREVGGECVHHQLGKPNVFEERTHPILCNKRDHRNSEANARRH